MKLRAHVSSIVGGLMGLVLLAATGAARASTVDADQDSFPKRYEKSFTQSAPSVTVLPENSSLAQSLLGVFSNPYLLFADFLVVGPSANGKGGDSKIPGLYCNPMVIAIAFFDGTKGLPAPGPVPVPATWILMASGLAFLGARRLGDNRRAS